MKIPIVKSFIDKKTGKPHNCGGFYESTNEKRIKELQDGGYLQKRGYEIKEEAKAEPKQEKTEKPKTAKK